MESSEGHCPVKPSPDGGEIDEIAAGREHILAAAGDLAADLVRFDFARPPLDHRDAQFCSRGRESHRERRLVTAQASAGAAKMPNFATPKILKLPRRESLPSNKLTRSKDH